MTATVVRYTTTPETAEENAALVEKVYAELAEAQPTGLRYVTVRIGTTFVHLAIQDGEDNPLTSSTAFGAFSSTIGERATEAPQVLQGEVVGSYGFV